MPEVRTPHASGELGQRDDVMGVTGTHLGVEDGGKSLAYLTAVIFEDLWDEGVFP